MFLQDYGNWLEVTNVDGKVFWLSVDDLPNFDLSKAKLVEKFSDGKKMGSCWVTFSFERKVVESSFLTVYKEDEVNLAVGEALLYSQRLGGSFISVGCLQK